MLSNSQEEEEDELDFNNVTVITNFCGTHRLMQQKKLHENL